MNTKLFSDLGLLTGRIILGLVIGAHGAQKLMGWFGGFGFEGTINFFTTVIGLPYVMALLIILLESVGMVALITGVASRIISAALIIVMIGAIVTSHAEFGFFMNWFGAQKGEGFEFHLLAVALASVIVFNGAGAFSVDAYIRSKIKGPKMVVTALFL
jgi:putative oxidoreductase